MSWVNDFFTRQSSSGDKNYGDNFQFINESVVDSCDFDFFNASSGKLGNNEIRSNQNLLNADNFAKYWQSGKHKDYKIYKGDDIDGDDQDDMIAVNPAGQVMGFNERYIVPAGETPYKRAYYAQNKEQRQNQSYQQFLEGQESKNGWKNLDKFKESRNKATHKIIAAYLSAELGNLGATAKEAENLSKKLVDMIASTFFATNVPTYQIRVIKGSPEFKKVLTSKVIASTIESYLPSGRKMDIAKGMLMSVRGYSDGGLRQALQGYLNNLAGDRISLKDANTMYVKILTKTAANKLYKQYKISPMYLVEHPEEATAFKKAVETVMTELDQKHKMDAVGNFN